MNKTHLILFLTISFIAQAQEQTDSDLFQALKAQDSIFFERSFNQCDLIYLESHITDDLKFYHDQGGFQDHNAFLENTKKYLCNGSAKKPIRQVDAGSLEVFPLFNNGTLYGAIQKGVHHFYLREEGQEDVWTSTAKFTHVWTLVHETWKISEVLSYDHQDPGAISPASSVEQLLKDNNVPALGIGVIENGVLNKVEVYGTLDKHTPAPYNTLFKVASLTKPIVVILTLKLIDIGLLDLDEPLHQYWIDPDIQNDERYKKLTPKMVLTHQTGFPNWRYLTDSNKLAFQFDPGTKYQYSGEGFEYLRKAVESKMGKSIEAIAATYLFEPLAMTDTHFWWDSTMDASRYAQNFDEEGQQMETYKYYEANAAANVLTTVEDYGKFLACVINGAGLSSDLYQEMLSHQVTLKENDFFGLGWEILAGFSDDEYALIHSGKDPGVNTLAIFFPKSKNGYLVFLNGDNVGKIFEELMMNRFYLGKELWDKR